MELLKKCLIDFNNQRTNKITEKEVDDDKQLRFTLLDMQKFANKYHNKQLALCNVVGRSEQLKDFLQEVSEWDNDYSSTNIKLKAKALLKGF